MPSGEYARIAIFSKRAKNVTGPLKSLRPSFLFPNGMLKRFTIQCTLKDTCTSRFGQLSKKASSERQICSNILTASTHMIYWSCPPHLEL